MKIAKIKRDTQAHRKKTDPYYNGKQHRSLREQAFIRDKGKCVNCDRVLLLETNRNNKQFMAFGDHIKPRAAGGKDELDNYQTLCKPCHDAKSNHDKQYYR